MTPAIVLAQHFVADATCAIHAQLGAAFRGDERGCKLAHARAVWATAAAIAQARIALGQEEPTSPGTTAIPGH